ncbi:MAG: alpha-N-arabinofuranosidase [Lachnospiraceae bacterium]|nr:alpha-N-arabinofuranosidase [Lachnospiraceae bacterium]
MNQAFNPYLPLNEYVPDAEPHVFGDRIYVYGSHDKTGAKAYCEEDYVVWSADVNNLSEWRCEGISYRKNQDPSNKDGKMQLWAPDVCKGTDGRYYLYYCFAFYNEIGVAVSDSPAGPFDFYGHVKYPDDLHGGKVMDDHTPFDPAVFVDDDGQAYLYWGFSPALERKIEVPNLSEEELKKLPPEEREVIETIKNAHFEPYSQVAKLSSDMVTLKEEPRNMIPNGEMAIGTDFEEHGFFEASSLRKIGKKYYFVYSSNKSHELCYAISDKPDKDFKYGGIIISNGDIAYKGNEFPTYTLSNNHGGIEKIGEKYYIFYHRCTEGSEFSRQGCAEQIEIADDGSIKQAEMTSCGLNNTALKAKGIYPASMACNITCKKTSKEIDFRNPLIKKTTRVSNEANVSLIDDIEDGSVIGYKYFDFDNISKIIVEIRGNFKGYISAEIENATKAEEKININTSYFELICLDIKATGSNRYLKFGFKGEGSLQMKSIGFM